MTTITPSKKARRVRKICVDCAGVFYPRVEQIDVAAAFQCVHCADRQTIKENRQS